MEIISLILLLHF
uniref:Uncharacterized protein n=1 Tax=Anguilla anguilla TaxID=7936 RepID=A0A0E9VNS7_ANGAN